MKNLILQGPGDLAWTHSSSLRPCYFPGLIESSSYTELSVVESISCSFPGLWTFGSFFLEYVFPTTYALTWITPTPPLGLSLDAFSSRKQPPPSNWLIRLSSCIASLLEYVPRRLRREAALFSVYSISGA